MRNAFEYNADVSQWGKALILAIAGNRDRQQLVNKQGG
jgi:hypothetical protein